MGYSFAPPEKFDDRQSSDGSSEPPPNLVDDLRGEDAYARRLRLTQAPRQVQEHQRPLDVSRYVATLGSDSFLPQLDAHTEHPSSTVVDQPLAATISRAPIRYNLPSAPSELPSSEAELEEALRQERSNGDDQANEDPQRSLRPGQKGFAERLMSKYGWTKGTGLGASSSGIINPLRVQVDKQKKRPDSEGGGFLGPGGRGKIIGSRKGGGEMGDQDGKFGAMSEVIILKGMVDGMDLDQEMEGLGEGGLMQEIGDECSEKVCIVSTFHQ
jgi:splicing factor 45